MTKAYIPKYSIQKRIRDSFIVQLRNAFITDDKFVYNDDTKLSRIYISDSTPNENLLMPGIIITSVSGKETRYLGDNAYGESDNLSERFTSLDFKVNVELLALSTPERDKLVDRVYELLQNFNDTLADNGIVVNEISFNSDSKKFVGDRWYYTTGFNIPIYCEWSEGDSYTDVVTAITATFTIGV